MLANLEQALAWTGHLHTRAAPCCSTKLLIAGQAQEAGIAEILPIVSALDKLGTSTPAGW